MRLRILDSGHGFGTKALFALIRTLSRQPVLDVVKLVKYRSDFYGEPMSAVTQDAMRGPSPWSVGDRELMAAFVAKTNQCEFCTRAHAASRNEHIATGRKSPQCCPISRPRPSRSHCERRCSCWASLRASTLWMRMTCGRCRRFAPTDRGCARGLFLVQCDWSVGRCLRVLRAWSRGIQGWREIPPRARLPLSKYSGLRCLRVRMGSNFGTTQGNSIVMVGGACPVWSHGRAPK